MQAPFGIGAPVCDGFFSGSGGEQTPNLWRVGGLAGGRVDVSVESPELPVVRDLVAQGSPVLLALTLTANGAPAGGGAVEGSPSNGPQTLVQMVDVSNPAAMRVAATLHIDGNYVAARQIDGVTRLVVQRSSPAIP